MSRIVITGGTGLIGQALTRALLEKNYDVVILTRKREEKSQTPGLSFSHWNVEEQMIDPNVLANADHVVHLAGAGVAEKRWTRKRKQEIVDSRVKAGELIVTTLKQTDNKVKTVISSSGIGWYGPDPVIPNPHPFVETDPSSGDFLGETCKKWEQSLMPAKNLGKRVVIFRQGIVLSADGGAIKEFMKPLRFGFAAILGNGKQMVSWIHMDDLVNLYIEAIEDERYEGVYNAVSPLAVPNKELVVQLGKAKRGGFYVPIYIPSFLLKLVLGEMSIEVLKSATASADRLMVKGFHFSYPSITEAVTNLRRR